MYQSNYNNKLKIMHSKDEFLELKKILKEKQFLLITYKNNKIISGSWIFVISPEIWYMNYIVCNYKEGGNNIITIYELNKLALKNNIKIINMGACSTNGGENLLENLYKFKKNIGGISCNKYLFEY